MALVTGATSGIGAAFAETLPASTGLLLVGRDQTRLEEMSARLATAGRTIASLPADLGTDEGRERVIARAGQIGIDLLINNAGRGKLGRLLDHELEEARGTVELNVVTPLVLTRALLPDMLAQARREGRRAGLIIVSSAAAFAPLPYFATYAASKAFDLVLAESLAEELRGEPVDVLALCPGATRTEFGRRAGFALDNIPWAAIRAWLPRRRCARSAGAPCWSAVDCAALPTRPSPGHAQPRPAVSASRSACSAPGSPEAGPHPRQEAMTSRYARGLFLNHVKRRRRRDRSPPTFAMKEISAR